MTTKGYFQQLTNKDTGIYIIYPVDESGQPTEALWADNDPKPVFLNQNNGWHVITEISVSPKILSEFKARLNEWSHKDGCHYVEYVGAPKTYAELSQRNFQY